MARVRTRFPKVFIGHPFKKRFPYKSFREIFKSLPFEVVYGNTDIETKQLLGILKKNIKIVDYCLFDLTYWNPNVSLELGMCEGLHSQTLKGYYVLLDNNRSTEVPSDIKGLQRLEYSRHNFAEDIGLGNKLLLLLKKEYWAKKIYSLLKKTFNEHHKVEVGFEASMKILAHFRDFENLDIRGLSRIFQGTRLRSDDREAVLKTLADNKYIKKESNRYVLIKKGRFFHIEN
jgi:hypothetical protein